MSEVDSWLSPLLIFLGCVYFLFGLDDLLIDLIAFKNRLKPKELSPKEKAQLAIRKQKKIAILIPAWRESGIISQMLRGNLTNIAYENYHIFVGCYPNDLPTFRAVSEVARETGRITPILNSLPGPTSKGQLLNAVLHEIRENHYPCFDLYLFHDAEDIIHPLSLQLMNAESDHADFIQIPVFSLPVEGLFNVGATYMDEFAEIHTRDLLVRKHLDVSIPSAGVGFALTRTALSALLGDGAFELFDPRCLTEDYALGLKTHQFGLKQSFPCFFEYGKRGKKDWIATYEYFPKKFDRSVRQKARWTEGIALQSAKKFGWFGTFLNCIFLFRDRKSLMANLLGMIGLCLLPFAFQLSSEKMLSLSPIFGLNTIFLMNRLWQRSIAFKRVYPLKVSFEVVLRYPLSIVINGLAGMLAIKNYSRSVFFKKPSVWVKTEHELPKDFGQVATAQEIGVM